MRRQTRIAGSTAIVSRLFRSPLGRCRPPQGISMSEPGTGAGLRAGRPDRRGRLVARAGRLRTGRIIPAGVAMAAGAGARLRTRRRRGRRLLAGAHHAQAAEAAAGAGLIPRPRGRLAARIAAGLRHEAREHDPAVREEARKTDERKHTRTSKKDVMEPFGFHDILWRIGSVCAGRVSRAGLFRMDGPVGRVGDRPAHGRDRLVAHGLAHIRRILLHLDHPAVSLAEKPRGYSCIFRTISWNRAVILP